MTDNKTNGCGACSGFLRWLRPPHHEFFQQECLLHDELYNMGGTEADRRKADYSLFWDMVQRSCDYFKGRKAGSQTWFIILAYAYYKAVRIFGKSQFNYK